MRAGDGNHVEPCRSRELPCRDLGKEPSTKVCRKLKAQIENRKQRREATRSWVCRPGDFWEGISWLLEQKWKKPH